MSEPSDDDRRAPADRRRRVERRSGSERRDGAAPRTPAASERRRRSERRRADRRAGVERRLALPLTGQLRTVIELLFRVSPERLTDEDRRRFDAAIFRLRYALDSLEDEPAGR
ncbi:MAG TPA: hypothetical protein VD707_02585 [Gemmatimonadales bacterium]|nr:hypothetical protein [Gemmatimonadales bacterium]